METMNNGHFNTMPDSTGAPPPTAVTGQNLTLELVANTTAVHSEPSKHPQFTSDAFLSNVGGCWFCFDLWRADGERILCLWEGVSG